MSVQRHIERINEELGIVKEDISAIKTNINWLKWLSITNFMILIGLLAKSVIIMQ